MCNGGNSQSVIPVVDNPLVLLGTNHAFYFVAKFWCVAAHIKG